MWLVAEEKTLEILRLDGDTFRIDRVSARISLVLTFGDVQLMMYA